MSGFYEWDSDKHKFLFDSSEPLYLAGFYRNHSTASGSEDESIILTTKPTATIAPIHDRMPVLLSKADVLPWITDVTFARNYLPKRCLIFTHNLFRKPKRRQKNLLLLTAFLASDGFNKQ